MTQSKRVCWDRAITFSITKADEGGPGGAFIIWLLKSEGIPARRAYSPYVGQTGVEIPKKFERKARRLINY